MTIKIFSCTRYNFENLVKYANLRNLILIFTLVIITMHKLNEQKFYVILVLLDSSKNFIILRWLLKHALSFSHVNLNFVKNNIAKFFFDLNILKLYLIP